MRRLLIILAATACLAAASPQTYEVRLTLGLDDFQPGLAAVETLLARHEARLLFAEIDEEADGPRAYQLYQLPAGTSRRVVASVKELGEVVSESSRLRDVGAQLAELGAATETLEKRVEELAQAVEQRGITADERIRLQRRLNNATLELEETRRRYDSLREAVDWHSLELELVAAEDSAFDKAARLIFTVLIPGLVFIILAFFIGMRLGRGKGRIIS